MKKVRKALTYSLLLAGCVLWYTVDPTAGTAVAASSFLTI